MQINIGLYEIKIKTHPFDIAKSSVKKGQELVLLHIWLLNTNKTWLYVDRKAQVLSATIIKTVSRHLQTTWSKN